MNEADVMLQVIILARESGLKLELSDIPEKSLVPEPLKVRTNLVQTQGLGYHQLRR